MNVTNGLEITHLMHTDGRSDIIWTPQGETNVTAEWEDQKLVIRLQDKRNPEPRTRYFSLAEEGKRLIIKEMISIPKKDEMVSDQLVYDLQP